MDRVTVRAPATSANLGPGFDCIGIALDLWNEVTVERGEFSFEAQGEGASELPLDTRNLVVTGVEAAFTLAEKEMPPSGTNASTASRTAAGSAQAPLRWSQASWLARRLPTSN